jgi:hypothetical protein
MGYAIIVAAVIAAVGTVTNTVLTILLRRFVSPPSGDTLGEVAERAHHLAAVGVAGVKWIAEHSNGGDLPAEMKDTGAVKAGEPPV